MEFGIMFDTHVDKWDLVRYAEELGYDRAWVPDSQMIWSDCYAVLALAAANTRRIKLGTGVAIPGTRIAPVTAHSIASINQIAPGRVFLGIGTGHTAMRVMGQNPMPIKQFREYLRVVRALLHGEAVDYTYAGRTQEIEFLHRDRRFINLDDPIPIFVAGNAPRACETVGMYGDGWITFGGPEAGFAHRMAQIRAGARAVGRTLPAPFPTTTLISGCVLRSGEKLTSARVIEECGTSVTAGLHFLWEAWRDHGRDDAMISPPYASLWGDYLKHVNSMSLPEEKRFRQIHEGHCTYVTPAEKKFVTPEAIKASCLVGEPEEIVDQLRGMERAGIGGIALLPPADCQRRVFRDFAELVMPRMR